MRILYGAAQMPNNGKLKVLLVQLVGTELWFRPSVSNIPLAAGYLKAMAHKEGLLNEVEIKILDLDKNTILPGDAKLIDLIISIKPDILGLSLYTFNSIQSLFIAKKVKERLPNINIVVGGPEVTLETEYILNNPVVDIGCIGQGELTFAEILRNILKGQNDHSNISGIFYRKSGKLTATHPREPIKDLDVIPSPYLLGFIDLKKYETVSIETYRGCFSKCAYCAYGTRPLGYFSPERIYQELKIIPKTGKRKVYFLDSSFYSRNFYEICEKIKKVNHENKLEFLTEFNVAHLNKERANWLKECNFKWIEIGLQTINPITLRNVNRPPVDKKQFLEAIELLKEREIECSVGIILGLPNDTFDDFKGTVEFLRNNNVPFSSQLLQLFPGTRLRKQANKYGIKAQSKPPYLTIETPYITRDEIEKAIVFVLGKSRPVIFDNLVSYFDPCYSQVRKKESTNSIQFKQFDGNVNKVIIELDASHQKNTQLERLGKTLSRLVCPPFTAWFQAKNIEENVDLMTSFMLPITVSNPFLPWNIIIESTDPFHIDLIKIFKRNICSDEKIISDSRQLIDTQLICSIFDWKDNNKEAERLKPISDIMPFYWALDISNNDYKLSKNIDNILKENYSSGVLLDFTKTVTLDFIINTLLYIKRINKDSHKEILFRNLAAVYLAKLIGLDQKSKYYIDSFKYMESILSFDKNISISSTLIPDGEATMDLTLWQIRCQSIVKSMIHS